MAPNFTALVRQCTRRLSIVSRSHAAEFSTGLFTHNTQLLSALPVPSSALLISAGGPSTHVRAAVVRQFATSPRKWLMNKRVAQQSVPQSPRTALSRGLSLSAKVAFVATAAGVGAFAYSPKLQQEGKLTVIAIARFLRASYTAVVISLDYKLSLRNIADDTSEEYRVVRNKVHQRAADRILSLCRWAGGIYIKGGQHVGALDYLLPAEYVHTLKVLHNQAPRTELKEVSRVFKEDVGKGLAELFLEFDSEPIGAASLAQVHRAVRASDGAVVAVKVQHPFVRERSEGDMRTIEIITKFISWMFPEFEFAWLAEEMRRNLPVELDFVQEGRNADELRALFRSTKYLKIPEIHWDLTSRRVLTMEFIDGGKVDDVEYMQKNKIDVNEVSRRLKHVFSEMIYLHGFVHCDPHPGNVLVQPPRGAFDGPKIILLDHGLYQRLSREFRLNYCRLWKALIEFDEAGIRESAARLGGDEATYHLFACMLTGRTWDAIETGIGALPTSPEEIEFVRRNMSRYLVDIAGILNRVPRPLLLLLKTNDLLRSVDHVLQTNTLAQSFAVIARLCIRAIHEDELSRHPTVMRRMRILLSGLWNSVLVTLYETALWIISPFVRPLISGAPPL
eukprot:Opistho-2@17257